MKTLTDLKVSRSGDIVTITGKVSDKIFDKNVQQTTVGYLNPENMKWPRQMQLSHEAFFVKAFGNGLGIMHEDMVLIANVVEPKTSFPPVFKSQVSDSLTCEITSEIEPDFQWQVSDSLKPVELKWDNIEGQTSKTLDRSKVLGGKFVRCVASSEAGEMFSNPVLIK